MRVAIGHGLSRGRPCDACRRAGHGSHTRARQPPPVILWHGFGAPGSEAAMMDALPLDDVDAVKVYLGLPLFGARAPAGGMKELARRQAEDVGTEVFKPVVVGAGVLGSSVLNRWYRLTFTDVNVKPTYVNELPLPPLEEPLARLVQRRLAKGPTITLERAIDRLVIDAYGLDETQTLCFEQGYWSERFSTSPLPTREEALSLAQTNTAARLPEAAV